MADNQLEPFGHAARAVSDRKRVVLNRFSSLIDMGWPLALFRALNGVLLILVGTYFRSNFTLLAGILLLVYVILFGFFEFLVSETLQEIRENARTSAERASAQEISNLRKKQQKTEVNMEMYFAAQDFLSWRIAKTGEVVTSLIGLQESQLRAAADQSLKKVSTINVILKDLCVSLRSIAAKSLSLQLPDAEFRATYLEVCKTTDGNERLEFIGWHTRDGTQPRSMSEKKTFSKGKGCAGIAWERKRPVIEDHFKDHHEWEELYVGQGSNYKSMVSVPVMRGSRDLSVEVIGVVTIDTAVKEYFGAKDDRVAEERAGSIVRPYASYIAFLTAVYEAVTLVVNQIAAASGERAGSSGRE